MITDIISSVLGLIDKVIPDPKQAADAKQKILELQQQGELAFLQASSQVVVAEAQSESWLARNWRPLTALTFTTIIANNYLVYPYMSLFGLPTVMLAIPPDMWDLMKIMIGGYVAGRSIKQAVEAWKK